MIRRTEGPDEFGAQSSCPRLMGGRWGVGSCPSLQGSQDWLGAGVVPHPHPALCMFPNFVTLYVHHSLEPGDARPAGVEAIAVPFPPRSHFLPVPSISPPPVTQASDPTLNQGPRACPGFPDLSKGQRVPRSRTEWDTIAASILLAEVGVR